MEMDRLISVLVLVLIGCLKIVKPQKFYEPCGITERMCKDGTCVDIFQSGELCLSHGGKMCDSTFDKYCGVRGCMTTFDHKCGMSTCGDCPDGTCSDNGECPGSSCPSAETLCDGRCLWTSNYLCPSPGDHTRDNNDKGGADITNSEHDNASGSSWYIYVGVISSVIFGIMLVIVCVCVQCRRNANASRHRGMTMQTVNTSHNTQHHPVHSGGVHYSGTRMQPAPAAAPSPYPQQAQIPPAQYQYPPYPQQPGGYPQDAPTQFQQIPPQPASATVAEPSAPPSYEDAVDTSQYPVKDNN